LDRLKVLFIIANQNSAHEGVARPFLNLSKGLVSADYTGVIICFRCGKMLVSQIEPITGISPITADSKNELIRGIRDCKPDYVMCDDEIQSLNLLNYIDQRTVMTVAYAQILSGSHVFGSCFETQFLPFEQRMKFKLAKLSPLSIVSFRYIRSMHRCDLVLANSNATATFLHVIYNIEPVEIVYPPVDTEVFRPKIRVKRTRDSKEIVLYLGSHGGDTQRKIVEEIVDIGTECGYGINAFGNLSLLSGLRKTYPGLTVNSNLEDEQLTDLYSRSRITICPQKWELFGYAAVESMACGTPVLAFNCLGYRDSVLDGRTGFLTNNAHEFLGTLHTVLTEDVELLPEEELRRHVVDNFSISSSTRKLAAALSLRDSNKR
jgi:glycosyltransferase involved in cell wall biosynthesis